MSGIQTSTAGKAEVLRRNSMAHVTEAEKHSQYRFGKEEGEADDSGATQSLSGPGDAERHG